MSIFVQITIESISECIIPSQLYNYISTNRSAATRRAIAIILIALGHLIFGLLMSWWSNDSFNKTITTSVCYQWFASLIKAIVKRLNEDYTQDFIREQRLLNDEQLSFNKTILQKVNNCVIDFPDNRNIPELEYDEPITNATTAELHWRIHHQTIA